MKPWKSGREFRDDHLVAWFEKKIVQFPDHEKILNFIHKFKGPGVWMNSSRAKLAEELLEVLEAKPDPLGEQKKSIRIAAEKADKLVKALKSLALAQGKDLAVIQKELHIKADQLFAGGDLEGHQVHCMAANKISMKP